MNIRRIQGFWPRCGLVITSLVAQSCLNQPDTASSHDAAPPPKAPAHADASTPPAHPHDASTPPAHLADAGTPPDGAAPAKPSTPADTDADFKEAVTGTNVTATYRTKYDQDVKVLFGPKRKALMRKYRVILIPGFVTGFYMEISQIAKDKFARTDSLTISGAE